MLDLRMETFSAEYALTYSATRREYELEIVSEKGDSVVLVFGEEDLERMKKALKEGE